MTDKEFWELKTGTKLRLLCVCPGLYAGFHHWNHKEKAFIAPAGDTVTVISDRTFYHTVEKTQPTFFKICSHPKYAEGIPVNPEDVEIL